MAGSSDLWINFANKLHDFLIRCNLVQKTYLDVLNDKPGGGPHGLGDPQDKTLNQDESKMMISLTGKKVNEEKCIQHFEAYMHCMDEDVDKEDCTKIEKNMHDCKNYYYTQKFDEVENECKDDYLKLRSKYRETGKEEDLKKLKLLFLPKGIDRIVDEQLKS